jgi:N-acyl homoserine lactone hydrolase
MATNLPISRPRRASGVGANVCYVGSARHDASVMEGGLVRVTRLHLTDVHPDPSLPWANGDVAVFAYLIDHPDGLILVDTGVGEGNELIDALYHPDHHDLAESIAGAGRRIEDVSIIINSHLHFDHCGNNRLFPGVPIVVQRREYEAAQQPYYTDPEWVDFPGATIEQIQGDWQVASGVRIISTPGHTPGHQSVVVDSDDERVVICAQAAYTAADFSAFQTGPDNTPTEGEETQRRSIELLHDLDPHRVCFSHDRTDWLGSAGA